MITEDTIMYLKEKYNGHKIIYVRFSNEEFIFRTLSKKNINILNPYQKPNMIYMIIYVMLDAYIQKISILIILILQVWLIM